MKTFLTLSLACLLLSFVAVAQTTGTNGATKFAVMFLSAAANSVHTPLPMQSPLQPVNV